MLGPRTMRKKGFRVLVAGRASIIVVYGLPGETN
jgi:hypothetical protein